MKKIIVLMGCAALFAGCKTHDQGGMGNNSGTDSGMYQNNNTDSTYHSPSSPNSPAQAVPDTGGSSQSATGDSTGRHP